MDFDIADFTAEGSAAAGSSSLLTEARDAGVNMAAKLIPAEITNSPIPTNIPKNVV